MMGSNLFAVFISLRNVICTYRALAAHHIWRKNIPFNTFSFLKGHSCIHIQTLLMTVDNDPMVG